MKYLIILVFSVLFCQGTFGQYKELKPVSVEMNYFYGSILEHNLDISHLITGHPTGYIVSYNRKTYGWNEWESRYNFPDWGFSLIYQDLKNEYLGKNYGIYAHYNFYFLQRMLRFGVSQGIAFASNPYDIETNFQNNAYGSKVLSSTHLRFEIIKENIVGGLGAQVGLGVVHYSNANLKAPNNSTNSLYFSAGLSYQFDEENFPARISHGSWPSKFYAERIHGNAVFYTGINEADVNGLGQYPFYVFSFYADKRINYKSSFQLGVDFIFSDFLIYLIRYREIAFPGDGIKPGTDYRRVGVFIGHELRFNRTSFVSQLGRYVYWPYEFENQIYNRLGFKRYFLNDHLFAIVSLRAHWAKAEAVEFGVGVRL
jgi:Lipid A 3-O-deacylase (PagL)